MVYYLVRHGEIESNIRKVYAGWSDERLTKRGARQAEKAGEVLTGKGIVGLYCSPLRRAVQTAEIIGQAIGRVPVADENFKEMGLGPWEGLSEDEIEKRFPEEWRVWNTRPADLRLDGRETLKELQERVLEGLQKISTDYADYVDYSETRRLVVVTHVALIRVLLLYVEGRDLNEYKKVPVANGKVFRIAGELMRKR